MLGLYYYFQPNDYKKIKSKTKKPFLLYIFPFFPNVLSQFLRKLQRKSNVTTASLNEEEKCTLF